MKRAAAHHGLTSPATCFRTHKPRFLAAWGKNDPFFLPRGAEAFRRDIPGTIIHFFDAGHFTLETHAKEIAAVIRDFLAC
jgi:pimeloyl-ACP methyl ester carboxylesterase